MHNIFKETVVIPCFSVSTRVKVIYGIFNSEKCFSMQFSYFFPFVSSESFFQALTHGFWNVKRKYFHLKVLPAFNIMHIEKSPNEIKILKMIFEINSYYSLFAI